MSGHHNRFCKGGLEFLTDYEVEFKGTDAQNLRTDFEKKCEQIKSTKSFEELVTKANLKCREVCSTFAKKVKKKAETEFTLSECESECGDFAFESRTEMKSYLAATEDLIRSDCGKKSTLPQIQSNTGTN